MAVCTTCLQPGISGEHDCPGRQFADVVFSRHQGRGITIDEAPAHTRIAVQVLTDRYAYLHMPAPDRIVFADQVVYRITGYQEGALELELVEDWRKPGVLTFDRKLTEEEMDEIKSRWLEKHGNPEAMHSVVPLEGEEEQPS